MKGKCIYCKKKGTSKEHAFPESLLHKCAPLGKYAPNWIIRQLCEDCNSSLGKLDEILATRSSMAVVWRRIKNEWEPNKTDKKSESQASAFYNAKAYGMNPVRLLYPDPLYGNLVALHEDTETSAPGFHPTPVVRAQAPQMILTQYTEGQTKEEVIAANCEKWDADELVITASDEHEGVYYIAGNTYIFPPQATRDFLSNLNTEQEFVSKFIKKRDNIRYDLNIIFFDEGEDLGKIKAFYERFNASAKKLIEGEHFEPKEFSQKIMVVADQKAKRDIDRAVAKIAFHSFLYHYRQFSGHEPIFNDIKAFIEGKDNTHEEIGQEFVTGVRVTEDYVWPSDEHFHILRFYVHEGNIICQMAFFTGLSVEPVLYGITEPFASEIILAGDHNNARRSPYQEVSIPFYVHTKSQLKRRIIPVRF